MTTSTTTAEPSITAAAPRLGLKQQQSIAWSNARINIWEGAVRAGKTVPSLLRWLMYVNSWHSRPRGGHLIVSGATYDTVYRNIWGPLMDPAVTGRAARFVQYTRGAPSGKIFDIPIEVITANDAKAEKRLRGLTCAGAYVDEITVLPETFFDQLLARMSVAGALLFGTTNPDSHNHWLRKRFILRAGEVGARIFTFTLDDNPGLSEEFKAALRATYTGLWHDRMILGKWVMAEGMIYDAWSPTENVVDELPPIDRWISCGVDYGTTNPFHAVLLGIGPSPRGPALYATDEWRWDSKQQHRQLSDFEYSVAMRGWLDEYVPDPRQPAVVGLRPEFVAVDPSAASFRRQLHNDGLASWPADNDVKSGIRVVASLIGQRRLLVHSRCKGLLDEIPAYAWDDAASKLGRDEPMKVNDHGCDALRYGVFTPQQAWHYTIYGDTP